jgi:hypothetical protein
MTSPAFPPTAAETFLPQKTAWHAPSLATGRTGDARISPSSHSAWKSLGQRWRDSGTIPGFRPGRARATWDAQALTFTLLFRGCPSGNRARRLNERTWELGDIGEVFVQLPGRAGYWEFHVTPENQRLQLHWPVGGLAAFRSGQVPFEEFTLGPRTGLTSTATVWPDRWRATLTIPAAVLGLTGFSAGQSLRAAVCRYDCVGAADPVCSSTAPLLAPSFHRPKEWSVLTLHPT